MPRLNVHLALDTSGSDLARAVNETISSLTKSSFVFTGSAAVIPHVTLAMGKVEDTVSAESIIDSLTDSGSELKAFKIRISRPYVSTRNGRYILSDAEPIGKSADTSLVAVQRTLAKIFGSDAVSAELHITFAHITERQQEVETVLAGLSGGETTSVVGIEVSNVGAHGTCIDRLAALPFESFERV